MELICYFFPVKLILKICITFSHIGFEEELNNLEMLRKRKYFLDNKFGGGPSPIFPHSMGPLKSADYGAAAAAAAAAAAKLHPGLFPTPTSVSAVSAGSPPDFPPYSPFRNFPGAVGMLGPPMGQPGAGLAALRGSPMGLHQVSMMDQVRQEHQRQQQQQQQQQQPSPEDGISCSRKCTLLILLIITTKIS